MTIAHRRLRAQHLVGPPLPTAVDVVRHLGAVQAQDYPGASWAIALRAPSVTEATFEHEFTAGRILRTHVMRPTWHFVLPDDARWMLELTAPRISRAMQPYNRHLELTPAIFRRSHDAIARALEGGRYLTRAELAGALRAARVTVGTGQRLAHLVMQAELDRVVISGPRRAKQFTYAAFDARVPPSPARDREDSLARLAIAYFRSRGPATPQDFAWWSGLTVPDARRGIALAGEALERGVGDDRERWIHAEAPPPRRAASAHLLPNYDEYLVGFRDRSAANARFDAARVASERAAYAEHPLLVDGQIVGAWRRTLTPTLAVADAVIRVRLTPAESKRLSAAADRYAQFLARPVTLRR